MGSRGEKLMNILNNLFSLYNNTEEDNIYHIAIKNLLKHIDKVENCTIYDLAEICSVSKSTIGRLIQKLGYSNLSEFRRDIKQIHQKYTYFNRILPAEMLQSDETIVLSYIENMRNILTDLEKNLNIAALSKIVDAMHEANTIKFYTGGKVFAEIALQINLTIDNKETLALSRYAEQLEDVKTLNSSCFVFITGFDMPNTVDMLPIFKDAHDRGARIVLLTDTSKSQYDKYSEFTIVLKGLPTMMRSYGSLMQLDILSELYRKKYIDNR
jgi:DNA-binding MurR/RpiR family transcriptional regulator